MSNEASVVDYLILWCFFARKNRTEVLRADISEKTKKLIRDAETMGKLPTFPVVFDITTVEPLADIYLLLDCKKRIEK